MDLRDLAFVVEAHTKKLKEDASGVRRWDNKTPYYIHPIWCATMLLHETSLPEKIRSLGGQALLYHDVVEDTDAGLPLWLSGEVKSLISEMTFSSSEDEWENLWDRSEEARLLKLFDKVSNILDGIWMKPERKKQHLEHLKKLYEDVERNYKGLNILKLAKTLLNPFHQEFL